MSRQIRIGIVGVGNIAEKHVPGYLAIPMRARIVAVADVIPAVAEAKAKDWQVPRWFDDLQALLGQEDVDAVDLCLPHDLHVSSVQQAAAAGKHIYIEKPLGRTAQECRKIIESVEKRGIRLMVGHNLLFNPLVQKASELVKGGYIGPVFMIRAASYGWPGFRPGNYRLDKERSGGGVLIDTGVHMVYTMREFAGEAQAVSAMMHRALRDEMEGEDNAILNIEYASGVIGELVASYSAKLASWQLGFPAGWDQRVEVYGSDGTLKLNLVQGSLELHSEKRPPVPELADWRVGEKTPGHTTRYHLPSVYFDSFKGAVQSFVDSLLTGSPPPVTAQDGYRVAQVVDAAYESARTGRTVLIDSA